MPRKAERNLLPANDLAIKAAWPRGKIATEYKIAGIDGLTLRVEPTNTASFYVRYRFGGAQRRMRLGKRGVLSLAEAKARAYEIAARVERGEDPKATEAAREESKTFRQLWEERKEHGALSPFTAKSYEQSLEQYAFAEIGDVPAAEISADMIARLLRDVRSVSKHRAHTVRCAIGSTFRWGYSHRLVPSNPTVGLGFVHPATVRDRVVAPEEIEAFWHGVEARADSGHGLTKRMQIVLKLLLLTGQRNSTVAGARVDELTLDTVNPVWKIKRNRMKNKSRDHVLPLTPMAVQLFREALAMNEGSEFVFPGEGEASPHLTQRSVSHAMWRLRARVGIEDLRVHDFRKAMTTWLADDGVVYDVRTRIMHHSPPDVTSRNYDFTS